MAWWLLQNVVVTAGLALIVAIVCRTTRIGPVGRHALWLLVLVKFITPPLVVWPWAAPDPLRVAQLGIVSDETGGRRSAEAGSPALHTPAVALHAAGSTPRATQDVARGRSPVRGAAEAWPWLLVVWLAGSLGLAGIEAVRLGRLARRAAAATPAEAGLRSRVAALAARLGMDPVAIRVVPGDTPPAVWCPGRAQVLWPAGLAADASDVCVDGLLLHELAHVKRGDHLVGWIELAAGIVWWWNPLFWFVRSALREQAELACDAWVISALPNGRRAYAESLLALSGGTARGPVSLSVVGIRASSRRVLERRLVMIMQGRAPLRLTRVGLLSLTLLAAASMPGWAAASQDPPPPQPPRPLPMVAPAIPPPAPPAPVEAPALRALPPPQAPLEIPTAPTEVLLAPVEITQTTVSKTVQVPRNVRNLRIDVKRPGLPDEGQQLLEGFEADREAIQREADEKVDARRQALVKALEDLQDQYAKAGKLDEAVAIRDYLRAGLPGLDAAYALKRRGGEVR